MEVIATCSRFRGFSIGPLAGYEHNRDVAPTNCTRKTTFPQPTLRDKPSEHYRLAVTEITDTSHPASLTPVTFWRKKTIASPNQRHSIRVGGCPPAETAPAGPVFACRTNEKAVLHSVFGTERRFRLNREKLMRIRIHRFCALTLISVLWLFAFAAAQTDRARSTLQPVQPLVPTAREDRKDSQGECREHARPLYLRGALQLLLSSELRRRESSRRWSDPGRCRQPVRSHILWGGLLTMVRCSSWIPQATRLCSTASVQSRTVRTG